jgi:hypothetical protein
LRRPTRANLLIHAFAGEVLDGVKEDIIRDRAMRAARREAGVTEGVSQRRDKAIDDYPLQRSDVAAIRAAFPALQQQVHGQALVYLDNGRHQPRSPRR